MIDLLVFPGNVTIAVPGSFNKSLIRTKTAKIITSVYRYIQTAKAGVQLTQPFMKRSALNAGHIRLTPQIGSSAAFCASIILRSRVYL